CLGKLCVCSHECSFDLVVGEALILPQLTSLTLSKLHLLVEFKINNAVNKEDIVKIMPKIFGPNLPRSADFWWKVKVKYEIFGCEENIIDLYLEYYNRSDTFFNDKTNDSLTRNTLDLKDGEWIIIDAVEITGSSCTQVFP
ncbi:MAG TPA: hypothetical protein G4N92_07915, partial [Anaerolineae bacterium]|nr:hypothetical protein [Anaerolineae bacterium]